MKGQLFKKAAALALCAMLVSGGVPVQPVADIAGEFSIAASADTINSGTCGTCDWELDDEGTLTIHEGTLVNDATTNKVWGWNDNRSSIKKVVFDGNVKAGNSTSYMFYNCRKLESIEFGSFDTSSVTNMSYMFYLCEGLTSLDLSGFDTSGVTDMRYMFRSCYALTSLDLKSFVTSSVTDMSRMFYYSGGLTSVDLSSFDTSKVTNMCEMFCNCSDLVSLDLSSFDTSKVTDMSGMFRACNALNSLSLSSFDTSHVTNMSYMFGNCQTLTTIDLSSLDTSAVTNMSHMFDSCYALNTLDFSDFDTSHVTNMTYMFSSCRALTSLDLSSFDTSKVTNMSYMFSNCSGLDSPELGSFDTSSVTTMHSMFSGCKALTTVDLGSFDGSSNPDLSFMFSSCSALTSLELSGIDTSHVTKMFRMFYYCTGLKEIDLSSLDMSSVTDSRNMFEHCTSLERIYVKDSSVNWNLSTNASSSQMFIGCTNLKGVKDSAVSDDVVFDSNCVDASAAHVGVINGVQGYFTPLTQDSSLSSLPEFVNFTLDGVIGANFYYTSDKLSNDITKIRFTIKNSTVGDCVETVAVDRSNIQTIDGSDYIKVVCPVTIDKFADGKITAQGLTDNMGRLGQSRTLNINKYVNSVNSEENEDSMKAVVNNMKQYSIYAQQYVNGTSDLTALSCDDDIAAAAASSQASITDAKTIKYKGSQLILGNAVTLRLFFEGGKPVLTENTYKYLGKEYEISQGKRGAYYTVEVIGIPAFAVLHELTINYVDSNNYAGKVVYSPIDYLGTIVTGEYDDNTKDLARALYIYAAAVDEKYFQSN